MRRLLLIALLGLIIFLTSCTENSQSRQFGGDIKVSLKPGQKLITATWKQNDLWYLTEPMPTGYIPVTKTFYEDSNFGVWEGSVTFIESK